MTGYATPEEAARGDIPERFSRVVGVEIAPWGDHAVVLLRTNEGPATELYQVFCERASGGWSSTLGSNGPSDEAWFNGISVSTEWQQSDDEITLVARWSRDE